jgi:metal-responsive CopG/Arc/MetJ family transcriptional regulator
MSNVTVNISFQGELLYEIDAEAKRESRSRSELIREAARAYVVRQKRQDAVFALGDEIVKKRDLTEQDVSDAIREVRKRKKASR